MDKRKMLKPAVLSLSLLTIMSTSAVSPALGEIGDFFSSVDKTLIQLVAVMHSIAIVPSLLLANRLSKILSKKTVLLTGLALFSISGVSGGLAGNLYMLLLSRIFMGIGLGLVIPFSTALISDLYEGEEKTRMMGLSSSFNMLGGMISLLLAGQLALFSWRLPFLIYALGIPVLVLNAVFLPVMERGGVEKVTGSAEKLPEGAYLLSFLMFLYCVLFFILTPTMALYLRTNDLGDARMAGLAISFATLGGFTSGFVLPWTRKLTGKFFLPAMLAITGAGFVLLSRSHTVTTIFAGAICIGFANRSVYPLFFLKVTEGVTPAASIKATALLSTMIYVGQFMAPPFQRLVGILSDRPDTRFLYLFVAAVTLATASALFVHAISRVDKSPHLPGNRLK